MNLFERFEVWFACRKIDLGKWLNDSSRSYRTTYNEKTQRFETIAVGKYVKNGSSEWNAEQAMMKERRERIEKLCALDPDYKAKHERSMAAYRAQAERDMQAVKK